MIKIRKKGRGWQRFWGKLRVAPRLKGVVKNIGIKPKKKCKKTKHETTKNEVSELKEKNDTIL